MVWLTICEAAQRENLGFLMYYNVLFECSQFHRTMGGSSSGTSMKGISFDSVRAKDIKPEDFTLTHKGISSVNWDYSNSDFEFIFGEDKVCRVWSVLAEFLSPKVARLRRCDISFCAYQFTDSEMFNVFDSLVASLRSGEAIRVEKSNFFAGLPK